MVGDGVLAASIAGSTVVHRTVERNSRVQPIDQHIVAAACFGASRQPALQADEQCCGGEPFESGEFAIERGHKRAWPNVAQVKTGRKIPLAMLPEKNATYK